MPNLPGPNSSDGDKPGWGLLDFSKLRELPEFVFGLLYVIAALIGVYLLATAVLLVFRTFQPVWTFESLKAEDLRNLLIAIGAVIAAPFAIWRIIISHWQARAAQDQAKVARENHYTSLFTKAVEQLGAMREIKETHRLSAHENPAAMVTKWRFETTTKTVPNTEVRLGAIYALERIAQDSERDHWPIMETLCAYIRNNAGPSQPINENVRAALIRGRWNPQMGDEDVLDAERSKLPFVDVQAALSVIGRRSEKRRIYEERLRNAATNRDAYCLDLTGTNLQGARLDGLHFEEAKLDGSNLAFAELRSTRLEGASLNEAHLEGAWIRDAHFKNAHLFDAHLEGIRGQRMLLNEALLERAHLEGATLQRGQLQGIWLVHAHLECADLSHSNITDGCLMEAHLEGSLLTGVNFQGAQL